jgi:hypothetical protein
MGNSRNGVASRTYNTYWFRLTHCYNASVIANKTTARAASQSVNAGGQSLQEETVIQVVIIKESQSPA